MPLPRTTVRHDQSTAASRSLRPLQPPGHDTIRAGSRRWFLQTGTAGLAGLSLASVLQSRAAASVETTRPPKSVVLFWLSGGPSHIDMWDPKPEAPQEIRGPLSTDRHGRARHSSVRAFAADGAINAEAHNHSLGRLLGQQPHPDHDAGRQRTRAPHRRWQRRPGLPFDGFGGCADARGPNAPNLPAFVGLADAWKADIWGAGQLGNSFEPVNGKELPGRLAMPKGIEVARVRDRDALRRQFDRLRRDIDLSKTIESADRFSQMAVDMVTSEQVRRAFDLSQEPDKLRDQYGRTSLGQKTLLARRLVEAGVTFTVVSGAWGYFDHHGDEVQWGGIEKG